MDTRRLHRFLRFKQSIQYVDRKVPVKAADYLVSQQNEKFLFQEGRKFLFETGKLAG